MFESDNIVANFPEVFGASIYGCPCLSRQELAECGLGTLNPAG
jgi:hypothetical protein